MILSESLPQNKVYVCLGVSATLRLFCQKIYNKKVKINNISEFGLHLFSSRPFGSSSAESRRVQYRGGEIYLQGVMRNS